MSSLPRTVRYFPKMKVRGARNRRLAPLLYVSGAFDRLGIAAQDSAAALTTFNKVMEGTTREQA